MALPAITTEESTPRYLIPPQVEFTACQLCGCGGEVFHEFGTDTVTLCLACAPAFHETEGR
jgi:hypothetical protein